MQISVCTRYPLPAKRCSHHATQNLCPLVLIVFQFDIHPPYAPATSILSKFPGPTRHLQVLGHWFYPLFPQHLKGQAVLRIRQADGKHHHL